MEREGLIMGQNKELICESCSTTENTKYRNEYGGILCWTCHFNLVGEMVFLEIDEDYND